MLNKDNFDETLNTNELLNQVLNVLISNNRRLKNLIYEKSFEANHNNINKVKYKFTAKSLLLNLITIVSCFLAAYGTKKLFQYSLYGPDYNTVVLSYSTDTDKTDEKEEIKKKLIDTNDKQVYKIVTIENINPWEKINDEYTNDEYYERLIEKTILYGIEYEDLRSYIDLNLEELDLEKEYFQEFERKQELSYKELNQDLIQVVTKEIQDPEDSSVGIHTDLSEKVITNAFAISSTLFIYKISENILSDNYLKDFVPLKTQIQELRYLIKDIKCNAKSKRKRIKRIKYLTNEIKGIVKSNLIIKKKLLKTLANSDYMRLPEENKKCMDIINKYIEEMELETSCVLCKRI